MIREGMAVLIDLDGTLVLTSGTWQCAEERLLVSRRLSMTSDLRRKMEGLTLNERMKILKKHYALLDPLDDLCVELEQSLMETINQSRSAPGASKFITDLVNLDLKIAIVSNSSRKLIDKALEKKSWARLVPLRVSSDDVVLGKPNPEVFKLASNLLDVPPENCIVVEDSEHGASASIAAGMTCVAVSDQNLMRKRLKFQTQYVSQNLSEALPIVISLIRRPDREAPN